ncbi:MAG: lysine--tRNA ligase, partial [Firmicutes bacterium]|nr:lysine--tRNA ligase [Bacillota bacterium]
MAESNENKQITEKEINELLKIRREKLADLQARGLDPVKIVKAEVTQHSQQIKNNYDDFADKEVSIAGRLMSKRVMGKASFCELQDQEGRIQCYVSRNDIGEESYADFKKYDIGDILSIKGIVFKTKTEEISVKAHDVTLLSKSLRILPEKYHGLKDPDLRYRQRYVDLIVNPEVKETFFKRSAVIKSIRRYLDGL